MLSSLLYLVFKYPCLLWNLEIFLTVCFFSSQPLLLLPASGSVTGVYGDVQRVKILYNKKDSALIQMSESNQAQLGEWISSHPLLYGCLTCLYCKSRSMLCNRYFGPVLIITLATFLKCNAAQSLLARESNSVHDLFCYFFTQ